MKTLPHYALACSWCGKQISMTDVADSHGMCPTCLEDNWKIQLEAIKRERAKDAEAAIQEDGGTFGNMMAAAITLACAGISKLFFEPGEQTNRQRTDVISSGR